MSVLCAIQFDLSRNRLAQNKCHLKNPFGFNTSETILTELTHEHAYMSIQP